MHGPNRQELAAADAANGIIRPNRPPSCFELCTDTVSLHISKLT